MHESTTIIKEFQKVWRIFKYIEHQFYRRHIQGRGIHSPYLFDFVYQGVFNASKTMVPEPIRDKHRRLRRDQTKISWGTNDNRSVSSFVKRSSVPPKYGALLYRISHWFIPEKIIELGTGLGISALYLAAGSPDKQMHTIEGNKARASFAIKVIKLAGLKKVKVHHGDIDQQLEILLPDLNDRFVAFLDGNHRYDPTIKYVRLLIHSAGEEAVIIMDDIYWSKEMYRAWKEVVSWPEVRVSIDLYRLGILLIRKDLIKAHVKIKF